MIPGAKPKDEWLAECMSRLGEDAVFSTALWTDIEVWNTPTLPEKLDGKLQGSFLLQITSVMNVAVPKALGGAKKSKRLLKLLLTDGKQHIVGIEKEKVATLDKVRIGSKILVRNVPVRHTMLLLCSENCRYVGGGVRLEKEVEEEEKDEKIEEESKRDKIEASGNPVLPTPVDLEEFLDGSQAIRGSLALLSSPGSFPSSNDVRNPGVERERKEDEEEIVILDDEDDEEEEDGVIASTVVELLEMERRMWNASKEEQDAIASNKVFRISVTSVEFAAGLQRDESYGCAILALVRDSRGATLRVALDTALIQNITNIDGKDLALQLRKDNPDQSRRKACKKAVKFLQDKLVRNTKTLTLIWGTLPPILQHLSPGPPLSWIVKSLH